jgi:hypothetical protein
MCRGAIQKILQGFHSTHQQQISRQVMEIAVFAPPSKRRAVEPMNPRKDQREVSVELAKEAQERDSNQNEYAERVTLSTSEEE